ncbi:amidohydrolase family protein [Pseudonocardia sp. KRD291]|uniref:amidohydrolase family protein n=1 Tax=Pseudonocardia sp. KRD291 TaxID=2792007 RepID=UPI001C4A0F5A|nr:amidohydrolase family protein [Pseudonocardia sp. KRD291]MBW0104257.1 amidohydrolase family protein [Pseudonocardia sp. KRD291]
MYVGDGERYLVVDAQVHAWDGRPHNQAGPAGEQFLADLHHRHRTLDHAPRPLSVDAFGQVTDRSLVADVLDAGVDRAVLQPAGFSELFVLGLAPLAWHAELAREWPGRFVLSGELNPGADRSLVRGMAAQVRRDGLRGLTVVPARRPEARTPLGTPWLRRVLARAEQAGAGVVHVGVGPLVHPVPGAPEWAHAGVVEQGTSVPRPRWPSWAEPVRAGSALPVRARNSGPLPAGGYDATELSELAAALPRVRFVLGAGSLPTGVLCRMSRLPNVHVMLTELLVALRRAPVAAGRALGDLLAAFGPDRLLFGSGYPLVRPGRLVRELATYRYPAELRGQYPELDAEVLRAVLGGTAARLYGVTVAGTAQPGVPVDRAVTGHSSPIR